MENFFTVDIAGKIEHLPVLTIKEGVNIAFFNLHGNPSLTEHCGKAIAKLCGDSEVILAAESKSLQLAHVVARELSMPFYAVARKEKKLYLKDGISVSYGSSITTGTNQQFHISRHDANLLNGKKVAIIDDVISTGESLKGLEQIVLKAGGTINKKLFVLAEGDSKDRPDVEYLATIPLL